ncbi:hypothetical protein HYPSUDRAFT_59028 [Hypholoma sublateritium FD-334 SS-4]|uniref:Uncharacterized protein n=1 Tax=Hypholoma sublateritium (strain FD-334 SS-4) TaxID=945553 RepID=A0A0D2N7G3_HYPSF|nr:hypothetical protein HYPSUDRAFT_59028 [Hypholoma sublateritium FD-334 SS-4]
MLIGMNWKLADATPRNIMTNSGFTDALCRHLGWNHPFGPALSDLHPSLGNTDHVRRLIDDLRLKIFPSGTGFEGAQFLVEQQQLSPPDEHHLMDDGSTFHFIICMSRTMSKFLMETEYVTIDTSFKRVHHKWQEFEIESWDRETMRSVVAVRAFTTSQTAQAHLILLSRIFQIATTDTGIPVQFRHIHGMGFSVWVADAHKGQALGLGMFCVALCADIDKFCPYEPSRLLNSLDPYDHLRRFFRLCLVHFDRNIRQLRSHISKEVNDAMHSLASSDVHPDLNSALSIIDQGGKKAQAWLKDKLTGSKFVLPAIYQPQSLIPYLIWKSAPSSSNGNEQSHRNVNRDGVGLTILAGIMRGMQFDARLEASRKLFKTQGIFSRDQMATHFRRSEKAFNRNFFNISGGSTKNCFTALLFPPTLTDSDTHLLAAFEPTENTDDVPNNSPKAQQLPVPTEHFDRETWPNMQQEPFKNLIGGYVSTAQRSTYSSLEGALIKTKRRKLIPFGPRFQVQAQASIGSSRIYEPRTQDLAPFDETMHTSSFSSLFGALE